MTMESTVLGPTGEPISVIGYGAMHLSIKGRPPEEEARRVLHAALDAGITLIDTADVYCLDDDDLGHNERLIATVLRERSDGRQIRVATKAGIRRPRGAWTNDGRPRHIREACERSLRALGVDQLFLYQFHAPDPAISFEKSVEAFAALQREGKCRYVGLSNVTVKQIEAASRIIDIVSVQNRFSPYVRDPLENGVVAECERRGLTFLAYSPLGGARLSKKSNHDPLLRGIGERYGASPHAVTMAWLRSKSGRIVAIPGARHPAHIVDTAGGAALTLSAEDVAAIDGADFSGA